MRSDQVRVPVCVILCTYNPRRDLLDSAISSLAAQTVSPGAFEFVLVDNNSDPPVDARLPFGRIVREPVAGLTHARVAGIRATTAPLIVFLDDDNRLAPDYLERALEIADGDPLIGCFGGVARAALEEPVEDWKTDLLRYLGVRDYGPMPITSTCEEWGEWEPIGAGMVCRRDVAERFAYWVGSLEAGSRLGRSGGGWMSGDDTLIALAAYRLGYSCSYQPRLRLEHHIKPARLLASTLLRTIEGHGRSFVVLQSLRGRAVRKPGWFYWVIAAVKHRDFAIEYGWRAATLNAAWDFGYFAEARRMGV